MFGFLTTNNTCDFLFLNMILKKGGVKGMWGMLIRQPNWTCISMNNLCEQETIQGDHFNV